MCPVSRVNSSFSKFNSRKRRVKGAAGHSLRHTLLTLAFRVLSACLNMRLGALREQQLLRKSCFAGKLFIFEGSEPQKTRETRSRAQSPTQPHHIDLYGPDCNTKYATRNPARPPVTVRVSWCLPPRAPTLEPDQPGLLQAHANCGELWKELAVPKQRKQPHVRRRHPHLGSG